MSWTDNKALIVAAMKNLGYGEVPKLSLESKDTLSTHGHKTYSLQVKGSDQQRYLTNAQSITSDLVELRINYRCKSDAERDEAYEDFNTVERAITALAGFAQHREMRRFERNENFNFYYEGILRFYFGVRSCV